MVLGKRGCAGVEAERAVLYIVQAKLCRIEKGLHGHSPDSLYVEYSVLFSLRSGVEDGLNGGKIAAELLLWACFCHILDFLPPGSSLVLTGCLSQPANLLLPENFVRFFLI
jgi:hypothetical protein